MGSLWRRCDRDAAESLHLCPGIPLDSGNAQTLHGRIMCHPRGPFLPFFSPFFLLSFLFGAVLYPTSRNGPVLGDTGPPTPVNKWMSFFVDSFGGTSSREVLWFIEFGSHGRRAHSRLGLRRNSGTHKTRQGLIVFVEISLFPKCGRWIAKGRLRWRMHP